VTAIDFPDKSCTLQTQLLSDSLRNLIGECGHAIAVVCALFFCQVDETLSCVVAGQHAIDLVGGKEALVHQVLADGFEVGDRAGVAQRPDGVGVAQGVGALAGDVVPQVFSWAISSTSR
jgi:hypothetical protein